MLWHSPYIHSASKLQNLSISEFYSTTVLGLTKRQEIGYFHCILHYITQFCETEVPELIKNSARWKSKVIVVLNGDSNHCITIKWSLNSFAPMKSKKLHKFCRSKKTRTLPFLLLCFKNTQKFFIQKFNNRFCILVKLLSFCNVGLYKVTYTWNKILLEGKIGSYFVPTQIDMRYAVWAILQQYLKFIQ